MNIATLSHTLWTLRDSDKATEADFRAALEEGIGEMAKALTEIGNRIATQDNRCTCDAMFCVQEEVTIYGLDTQWSDDFVWIDISEGVHEVEAPSDGEETDDVIKSGFTKYWKTVMVAFTEAGAAEYIKLNGHNHRGPTRIYVESFRRCPEMIAIREYLLSLAKTMICPNCDATATQEKA